MIQNYSEEFRPRIKKSFIHLVIYFIYSKKNFIDYLSFFFIFDFSCKYLHSKQTLTILFSM